ncbi:nucleoside hydrolase [Sphingomonas glacialis]|uniref:nucleoside hydrolase n=1 Tax=Sphingomonas glacialis TaxID=658225 RepID=UPI00138673DF|nr:nucleoside hydrolase [Sphingomonas glacialis]
MTRFPVDRRSILLGSGLATTAVVLPRRAVAAPGTKIPQQRSARIIVDNDFAGDPDALIALAHQLMASTTRTTLVTSSPLYAYRSTESAVPGSAKTGRGIAADLIAQGAFPPVPVIAGAKHFGDGPQQVSAAAQAIVAEAMRDDPLPLFITCGGPLTNIAAALRIEPRIAARATLVWIGGGAYPDGHWEYNLAGDIAAARHVIEESAIPLWQVPQPAYRQLQMSVAEMSVRLRGASPLGRWLYDRFLQLPAFIKIGGSWAMGDSATVLLTALSAESSLSVVRPARRIQLDGRYGEEIPGRTARVFNVLDTRLTIEDFFALLALHEPGAWQTTD